MSERFALEALCEDCPMRNFAGLDCTALINRIRMDPEDSTDRAAVAAMPAGELLLEALTWSRPGRCDAIRDALPRQRKSTARWVSAISCAELYLMSEVYRDHILGRDL